MYIASDNPLPMIPFDELNPTFCVEPLTEFEEAARRQFSKLYVYHVGAHTHCGCGFNYRAPEPWEEFDPEEQAAEESACRTSRTALVTFLGNILQTRDAVELFACWCDFIDATPVVRNATTPDYFAKPTEIAEQGEWYSVHPVSQ